MMRKKSPILDAVHAAASDLRRAGVMDTVTMRKFDVLCLPTVKELTAQDILRIRRKNKVSQQVFARYLNASPSTIRQWEQGEKRPSGPSLKLLNLIKQKGIEVLT